MSQWISVKDRVPDAETDVLVYMRYGKIDCCRLDGDGYFRQSVRRQHTNGSVTHWMPLPNPPATTEPSGGEG